MTCAAVPRAGRTPVGLAQSQGARGSAHSHSGSVQRSRRSVRAGLAGGRTVPPPLPARPAGGPWDPRGCSQGSRGRRNLEFKGRPRPQLEGFPAVKGKQEAPAWCDVGSGIRAPPRMSGLFQYTGPTGARSTPRGPLALLPFSLQSYLCLRCLSWLQIYAAESERGGLET